MLMRAALIDAFEEANIDYSIQEDGTVENKSYINKMDQP